MNDIDTLLADSATRFFSDLCTREVMEGMERGEWLADAWNQTCEIGLVTAASMPLDDDTIGLSLSSLCKLAQLAGYFHVPLPLVETYIAQRALLRAGIPFNEMEPIALSTLTDRAAIAITANGQGGYTVDGSLKRVAWGRHAPQVLVSAMLGQQPCLVLLPRPTQIKPDTNLAGEPRDTLAYAGVQISADQIRIVTDDLNGYPALVWEGALLRAQQIAGALHKVLDMTIQYALEREQFGRPIAKFQAIQQQIAEQAAQTASAAAAADAAAHACASLAAPGPVSMAKIRTAEAATQATTIAHQVHGAMGFTHEHSLHFSTRRLLSWRDEFGSDGHWAEWFGGQLQNLGATPLWDFVTATHQTPVSSIAEESAA